MSATREQKRRTRSQGLEELGLDLDAVIAAYRKRTTKETTKVERSLAIPKGQGCEERKRCQEGEKRRERECQEREKRQGREECRERECQEGEKRRERECQEWQERQEGEKRRERECQEWQERQDHEERQEREERQSRQKQRVEGVWPEEESVDEPRIREIEEIEESEEEEIEESEEEIEEIEEIEEKEEKEDIEERGEMLTGRERGVEETVGQEMSGKESDEEDVEVTIVKECKRKRVEGQRREMNGGKGKGREKKEEEKGLGDFGSEEPENKKRRRTGGGPKWGCRQRVPNRKNLRTYLGRLANDEALEFDGEPAVVIAKTYEHYEREMRSLKIEVEKTTMTIEKCYDKLGKIGEKAKELQPLMGFLYFMKLVHPEEVKSTMALSYVEEPRIEEV